MSKEDLTNEDREILALAFGVAMRNMFIKEAAASIALDKDLLGHTCHNECIEFSHCPGNSLSD